MTLLARVRQLLGFDDAPSTAIAVRAALPHASGLDRRQFLTRVIGGIAGAAAASTLDLEQLLWLPGEKTILIPEFVGPAAGNTFLTMDWITREALRLLKQNLTFANMISRPLDTRVAWSRSVSGFRLGDTVQVPQRQFFEPQRQFFDVDPPSPPLGKLGFRSVEPVLLTDQVRIDLHADVVRALAERRQRAALSRYLEQPAAELAAQIRARGLNVFGGLPLPVNLPGEACAVQGDGLALRGVKYWDVAEARDRLMLDLLGGHSRSLQRKAEQS